MPRDDYPGLTEAIKARYEEEGPEKLAQEFGCSIEIVCSRAKTRGLKSKNRSKRAAESKLTEKQKKIKEAVRSRYAQEGAGPIAREFGVSVQSVHAIAFRMGIKSENHREHLRDSFIENTDNCNIHAFDEPFSDEALYFLGLIWTDGSVSWDPPLHELRLTLTEPEWDLLEACQSFLGIQGHMTERHRQREHVKWQKTLHVGNIRLVQRLVDLGIVPNKSNLDLPHPSWVPDAQFHHWARGWFDGDGSMTYGGVQNLSTPRLYWYGTKQATEHVAKKIAELADVSTKEIYRCHEHLDATWGVQWSNWRDVRKIILWLHQDGGTYALRKHDRPLAQARAPVEP